MFFGTYGSGLQHIARNCIAVNHSEKRNIKNLQFPSEFSDVSFFILKVFSFTAKYDQHYIGLHLLFF